jgi:hypothetical protein
MVEPDKPLMTMRRMLFAWWTNKVTGTENIIIIDFTRQLWLLEGASIFHYSYIASLGYS